MIITHRPGFSLTITFPAIEPKRGDLVNACDDFPEKSQKAIYLTTIEGTSYPYICVASFYEDKFKAGEKVEIDQWKYIQPLATNWNPETGIYEAEREV